jgi:uncharacterized membrane protein
MIHNNSKFFHPKDTLDNFFEIGILLKLLDGIIQTVSGFILLVIRPEHISQWAHYLTSSELSEDPHDFFASHIAHWANNFSEKAAVFAGIYLLAHGLIKIILVFEVMRNHLWAYLALIIVTAGFVVYQVYHLFEKPTFGFVLLTALDLAVIYLTAREYSKQKHVRTAAHTSD